MYGTTEIGAVLVNYPGARDYVVKPGSLGKPGPAEARGAESPMAPRAKRGVVGELMLWRRDRWRAPRPGEDRRDGYFYMPAGRTNVIISGPAGP